MEILEVVDDYVGYPQLSQIKEVINLSRLKRHINFVLDNDLYWGYKNLPEFAPNTVLMSVLDYVLKGIDIFVKDGDLFNHFKLIHHKCVMSARDLIDLDCFYDYEELDDDESIVIRKLLTDAPRRTANVRFFVDFDDYVSNKQLVKVV